MCPLPFQVLVLCFAVFLGSWSPLSWSIGYGRVSSGAAPAVPLTPSPAPLVGPIGPQVETETDAYATPNSKTARTLYFFICVLNENHIKLIIS